MTPMVNVRGLLWFNANDVFLTRLGVDAATSDPQALIEAVKDAARHRDNEHLRHAGMGGMGALKDYTELDLEEFEALLVEIEEAERLAAATKQARLASMKRRRREFATARADLILKMLDAGVPYRCAHADCVVMDRLTVDHITPLSRGGTDDLANLQFLCGPHNSAKGNRN